ncbi:hypothetical protein ONS95_010667 [Cadophora gregata]|uniref:uncharacterized protein n=1 Tax=Cadophora gregata TaxID=51156 RepID=UPI0026DCABA3|nr:uncharacterized protein ONS95_010667 [Cadophora gregata]KAK0122432.1 hypothetical protein ONS95_010667 [Cadophora gregata]
MEPMVTNAPVWEFGKRQNGNRFIGYTSSGTDWLPIACPTLQTVTESGTFFACAVSAPTSSSFGIATTCTRGSELPNPAGIFTCPGPCCSNTLYASRGDTVPYHAYACGTCVSTLFRDIPNDETTSSTPAVDPLTTTSTTSTTPSSSNPNGSLYSKGGLGSPSSSSTSSTSSPPLSTSPTSQTSSSSKSASKAWIAGAVIGPLVAGAIIAALAFWIWKLKRRGVVERERVVVVPGDAGGKVELDNDNAYTGAGGGGAAGRGGYGGGMTNVAEVGGQGVVEADGGQRYGEGAVELPGWRGGAR